MNPPCQPKVECPVSVGGEDIMGGGGEGRRVVCAGKESLLLSQSPQVSPAYLEYFCLPPLQQ